MPPVRIAIALIKKRVIGDGDGLVCLGIESLEVPGAMGVRPIPAICSKHNRDLWCAQCTRFSDCVALLRLHDFLSFVRKSDVYLIATGHQRSRTRVIAGLISFQFNALKIALLQRQQASRRSWFVS